MIKTVLFFACFFVFVTSAVHASPVDVPMGARSDNTVFMESYERADKNFSENIFLRVSGEFDSLMERKLENRGYKMGKAEGNFIQGKAALSFKKILDVYGVFGGAFDLKYKSVLAGGTVPINYTFEESPIYGFGISGVIYELKPEFGSNGVPVCFFGDINGRFSNKMHYKTVEDQYGMLYSGSSIVEPMVSGKWEEWQYALGASFKMGKLVPYLGGKYSRVKTQAEATVETFPFWYTTYDMGECEEEDSLGVFVGCITTPAKGMSLEVQGRFFDEEAVSVIVTLGF